MHLVEELIEIPKIHKIIDIPSGKITPPPPRKKVQK